MSSIGVSEFTFGFAFLFEQVNANWLGIDVAPVLPSLQMEQMAGWDVSIPVFGVPFFYQFKIPEYLYAPHATYINNGAYDGPYYRIDLHKRSNNLQHRLLKELAHEFPNTFYAAPEVITQAAFTEQFLDGTLVDNSRIIPLSDCDDIGPLDATQHRITFQPGQAGWAFHSESHWKRKSYQGRGGLVDLYHQSKSDWRVNDEHSARDLLERILSVRMRMNLDELPIDRLLREKRLASSISDNRARVLSRVADILSAEFGVAMLIAGGTTK